VSVEAAPSKCFVEEAAAAQISAATVKVHCIITALTCILLHCFENIELTYFLKPTLSTLGQLSELAGASACSEYRSTSCALKI
jgi:hypothetical protein